MKRSQRLLSLLLVVLMCVSYLPVGAFADEDDSVVTYSTEELAELLENDGQVTIGDGQDADDTAEVTEADETPETVETSDADVPAEEETVQQPEEAAEVPEADAPAETALEEDDEFALQSDGDADDDEAAEAEQADGAIDSRAALAAAIKAALYDGTETTIRLKGDVIVGEEDLDYEDETSDNYFENFYNNEEDQEVTLALNIQAGQNIILDLNGYSITTGDYFYYDAYLITVAEGATLTIIDDSTDGNGSIYTDTMSSLIEVEGTLNVKGGTVKANAGDADSGSAIDVFGGSVTVDGGSVVGYYTAIRASGGDVAVKSGSVTRQKDGAETILLDGSTLAVTGGTVGGATNAIVTENGATATVTGGSFADLVVLDYAAASVDNSKVTVTLEEDVNFDGFYILIPEDANVTIDLHGNTVTFVDTGDAIVNCGTLTLTDSDEGGKITCSSGDDLIWNKSTGTLLIDGGTYESTDNAGWVIYNQGKLTVEGSAVIQGTGVYTSVVVIGKAASATIDGNAQITASADGVGAVELASGASVTVKGNAQLSSTGSDSFCVGVWGYDGGSLGTYANETDTPSTSLTVEGGSISGVSFGITGNGTYDHTVIKITGGSVEATGDTAIYHPQIGDMTITGGEITGVNTGVQYCGTGTLTIGDDEGNGPTITTTGEYTEFPTKPSEQKDGSANDGAALSIISRGGGWQADSESTMTVNIKAGKFISQKNAAIAVYRLQDVNGYWKTNGDTTVSNYLAALTISGGTFQSYTLSQPSGGTLSDLVIDAAAEGVVTITGGTFTSDVKKYIDAAEYDQNDEYVVSNLIIAAIGETSYKTLGEAVDNAQDGDTITLTHKATLKDALTISENVTIDLAGYDLTATDGGSLVIAQDVEVTLKDTDADDNRVSAPIVVNGELTVESGTTGAITANAEAVVTVSGGTTGAVTANSGAAVTVSGGTVGGINASGATVTVTKGTVAGTDCGILADNGTSVTIRGGAVSGTIGLKVIGKSTANVTGGTINGTNTAIYAQNIADGAAYTVNIGGTTIVQKTEDSDGSAIELGDGAYLKTVASPKIYNDYGVGIKVSAGAELNVTGSPTIKAKSYAITTAGGETSGTTKITITGGTITSTAAQAISLTEAVEAKITKGTVSGGIAISAGSLTIGAQDSKTVISISGAVTVTAEGSLDVKSGTLNGAVTLSDAASGTISGGTFKGAVTVNTTTADAVSITGGTFKGTVSGTATGFISGGTFTNEPLAALLTNHYRADQVSGGYQVNPVVIATINGQDYLTLDEAVAAAKANGDDTLTLTDDVYWDGAYGDGTVLDISNLTIDLNDHTIYSKHYSLIFDGANATIKNGTIASLSKKTYPLFLGYGTNGSAIKGITVEDVIVDGGINAVDLQVTLTNVTATVPTKDSNWCEEKNSYQWTYYAIYAGNNARVTVNGGTYSSEGVAVLCLASYEPDNPDEPLDRDSMPGTLVINSGVFSSNTKNLINMNYIATDKLIINGGDFTGVLGGGITGTSGTVTIKGGSFKFDPTSYLGNGYQAIAGTDDAAGTWTVQRIKVAVNTDEYYTLQDAIDQAEEGDTITLTNNVYLDETVVVDKDITLNLAGHTITNSNEFVGETDLNELIDVNYGVTLTIEDVVAVEASDADNAATTVTGAITNTLTDGAAINVRDTAILNVTGGAISATHYGIYAENAAVNVSGGSITSTGYYTVYDDTHNITYSDGIYAYDSTVVISGNAVIQATKPADSTGYTNIYGIYALYGTVTVQGNAQISSVYAGIEELYGTVNVQDNARISGAYGIDAYGDASTSTKANVNISGGTIVGNDTGVYANYATVDITGGDISGVYGVYAIKSSAVDISDGTVAGEYGCGVYAGSSTVVTIKDDADVSGWNAVYASSSTVYVKGGTVTGQKNGVYASATTVDVSGGAIETTGYIQLSSNGYYYNYSYGIYAVSGTSSNRSAVTVSGGSVTAKKATGTYNYTNAYGIYVVGSAYNSATVTGGSVSSEYIGIYAGGQVTIANAADKTVSVSGTTLGVWANSSNSILTVGGDTSTNEEGATVYNTQITSPSSGVQVNSATVYIGTNAKGTASTSPYIYGANTGVNARAGSTVTIAGNAHIVADNESYGTGVVSYGKGADVTVGGNAVVSATYMGLDGESGGKMTLKGNAVVTGTWGAYVGGYSEYAGSGNYKSYTKWVDSATTPETTLIVEGGTLIGQSVGIGTNGSWDHTYIEISGGYVKAVEANIIYYPSIGDLTITGGTLIGTSGVQYCGEGTVTIGKADGTGPVIRATLAYTAWPQKSVEQGDGSFSDGVALSIVSRGGGWQSTGNNTCITVNILGGTLISDENAALALYRAEKINKETIDGLYLDSDNVQVDSPVKIWMTNDGYDVEATLTGDDAENPVTKTLKGTTVNSYVTSLSISGGSFTSGAQKNDLEIDQKVLDTATVSITGGSFTATPSNLSEGIYSVQQTQTAEKTFGDDTIIVTTEYNLTNVAPVAQIGNVYYATLQEAIDATDDAIIALIANVTESVTVGKGKSITLDLNGKTLTNTAGKDTITVALEGTLNVTGSGTVNNVSNGKAALFNNGTVILDGGTFDRTAETGTSKNTYYTILNHGTMTINAGTTVRAGGVTDSAFSSLVDNGYYNYGSTNERLGYVEGTNAESPSLTITGGTFFGGRNTIKNDDNAILVIEGGTFENFYQAIVQNHNVAAINGGTFTAANTTNTIYGVDNCGCGAKDLGTLTISGGTFTGTTYAIYERSSQTPTVTISGGSFTGTKAVILTKSSSKAVFDIKGGTFTGDVIDNAGNLQQSIKGGTFSVDVQLFVDASVSSVKQADGTFLVSEASPVAAIQHENGNTTNYASLQQALDESVTGDTVKLMSMIDVTTAITITGEKSITLDMNGYTMTANKSMGKDDPLVVGVSGKTDEKVTLTLTDSQKAANADSEDYTGGIVLVNGCIRLWENTDVTLKDINVTYNGDTVTDRSAIKSKGTVKVDAGTVVNVTSKGDSAILIMGNAELGTTGRLTVEAGASITGAYSAICNNGNETNWSTEITINGGTIEATDDDGAGIYQAGDGKLTINGGNISGNNGVEIRAGQLIVNKGATISGGTGEPSSTSNGNGATTVNAALAIAQHRTDNSIKVTINGGTFKGGAAVYQTNIEKKDPASVIIAIKGGSFTGTIYAESTTKFISGGTFDTNVAADYVATGYSVTENKVDDATTYTVDVAKGLVAEATTTTTETGTQTATATIGGSITNESTDEEHTNATTGANNKQVNFDVTTGEKAENSTEAVANKDVTTSNVTITADTAQNLTDRTVTVTTDVATVTLDNNVVNDVNKAANSEDGTKSNITLTVETTTKEEGGSDGSDTGTSKPASTIKIDLKDENGESVAKELSGEVTITMDIPEGVTINEDGTVNLYRYVNGVAVEPVDAKVVGDKIVFTTSMMGEYALYETAVDESELGSNTTADHPDADGDNICDDCGQVIGAYLYSYSLTMDGDIGVNFYMYLIGDVARCQSSYMRFVVNGKIYQVTVAEAKQSGNYYVFTCPIYAYEMTDEIQATFVLVKGGETVATSEYVYKYSAAQYAQNVKKKAAAGDTRYTQELVDMLNAMLNYGGATQAYFKHNLDNNAADLADTTNLAQYKWNEDLSRGRDGVKKRGEAKGIASLMASPVFDSKTTIRFYFKLEKDYDINAYVFTVDGKPVNYKVGTGSYEGWYYVETEGIAAYELRGAHVLNIYDGATDDEITDDYDGNLTVQYGPMTYVRTKLSSDTASQVLKDLCQAMYYYNKAAIKYFDSIA